MHAVIKKSLFLYMIKINLHLIIQNIYERSKASDNYEINKFELNFFYIIQVAGFALEKVLSHKL